MKLHLTGYDLAFPLLVGSELSPGEFDTNGEIVGTAFALGSGYLMTAGHVARALTRPGAVPILAMPRPGSGTTAVTIIHDIELLPHDLAVLRVPTVADRVDLAVPWYAPQVDPFADLWSIGFPYGLLPAGELRSFLQRTLRGHVVGNPTMYELATDGGRPVRAYELSFQAPRGLSGAPLFVNLGEGRSQPHIVGIVVGNASQSMVVFSDREVDAAGATTTIVERHESLNLGVAIQALSALAQESRLLGCTVGDFLKRRGSLRDAI